MGLTKIAVLCSGGGTNFQALINSWKAGDFENAEISLLIVSRKGIQAIERAAAHDIPVIVIRRKDFETIEAYDENFCTLLKQYEIDLVVTAGFLQILGPQTLAAYENRIINVHPSLIPSFCGMGFYGLKVHQAALEYGVKVTGATVHLVNHVVDGGRILLQKAVEVQEGDTPESLQRRVMEEAEWVILPKAVAMYCKKGDFAE